MSENSCCCSSGDCCGAPAIWAVSPRLSAKDVFGGWKVRWGIGRMAYMIEPGLYAVGTPNEISPVLVSANYKLTFDSLRKELPGLDCWLLILDTKGVNVWCAAGKGTFGTDELIKRLAETGLAETVSHKTLILPQLGASGVNANEIKRQTGFSVVYGPVRARDIKAFLEAGNKATEEMRTVKFTLLDRLILTPVELVPAAQKSLYVFGVFFLLNLFLPKPFGLFDFIAYAGAVLLGTVITPVLLPFIPGRAFSFKGGLLG
ncbi:MAG: acetyl-CoA synthase subunit gamma, partial [Clostridiales bacterium]|nr:acetyl-CoA synthase subunit gamma [Clostridiales bacterium]